MPATASQTEQAKRRFLAAYAKSGVIRQACRVAKVGRATYWEWTERDEAFVLAARQAQMEAGDYLEEMAVKWATVGIPTIKEVYERDQAGTLVLVRTERQRDISPTMLIFMLKGAKPEKYRERIEHSGFIGPVLKVYAGFDPAEV